MGDVSGLWRGDDLFGGNHLIAGLGGLLYGIDVGIIAGALPYLEATSKLTAQQLSFIVAAVLLGSVISTLFAGMLADLMGRKKWAFALIVVGMVLRDAPAAELYHAEVHIARLHHQGRIELLENVAVALQQQAEELAHIMRDQIEFDSGVDATPLNGVLGLFQAHDLARRQKGYGAGPRMKLEQDQAQRRLQPRPVRCRVGKWGKGGEQQDDNQQGSKDLARGHRTLDLSRLKQDACVNVKQAGATAQGNNVIRLSLIVDNLANTI